MRDVTLMCQHHILLHTSTYFTHLITLHNAQLKSDLLSLYYYLYLISLRNYQINIQYDTKRTK
jgi:hypothetical protein